MAKRTHSVAALQLTVYKTLEKPLKCYRAVLRLTVKTDPSKNLSYQKNDRQLKNRELNVSKCGYSMWLTPQPAIEQHEKMSTIAISL